MPFSNFARCAPLAMVPLALLLAAAPAGPAAPLSPGLWRFTNTPLGATLDGRPLRELPVGPITSETICLTPEQAAQPARWLARDLLADCTLTRAVVARGKVDIAGTCPPSDDGAAPGALRITGAASATSYSLRFETVAHGDNGAMGFSGRMEGRRAGPCPG